MAVMLKEFQIRTLQGIFTGLNPGADPDVIDWESYVDSELTLPENAGVLRTRYPEYRWSKEDVVEEQTDPELRRIREQAQQLRVVRGERAVAEETIKKTEEDVRGVVKQEMDKEISALRDELASLITKESRMSSASLEDVEVMRSTIERMQRTINEMGSSINIVHINLRKFHRREPQYRPTEAEHIEPIIRPCLGEIVTGYRNTGRKDLFGKDITEIVSRPCGSTVVVENPLLEYKFLQLAVRSHRLGPGQAAKMRNLCPTCQISQYGNTLAGMICEDAQKGMISGQMILAAGIRIEEFLNVCRKTGYDVRREDVF